MRPYSPFIIEMANKLNTKNRTEIKKRLLNELFPLLRSYTDYELQAKDNENCFHLFVLSKKKL